MVAAVPAVLPRTALRPQHEAPQPARPGDTAGPADMPTVVFEGALVVSRSLDEPRVFADQLRHDRAYLELLFAA